MRARGCCVLLLLLRAAARCRFVLLPRCGCGALLRASAASPTVHATAATRLNRPPHVLLPRPSHVFPSPLSPRSPTVLRKLKALATLDGRPVAPGEKAMFADNAGALTMATVLAHGAAGHRAGLTGGWW